MQNCLAHTKATCRGGANGIFAGEGTGQHVNLSLLANRAKSQGLVLILIHSLLGIETIPAKVEQRFFIFAQFDQRFERPPYFAAKSLQRPHLALC